jgi:hypothetical protein
MWAVHFPRRDSFFRAIVGHDAHIINAEEKNECG